jgi:ribonuclease D
MSKSIFIENDLNEELYQEFRAGGEVGIDCEMMGLNPFRDRLCLVQIASVNGTCALIHINESMGAPNLKRLLEDEAVTSIFHYARMDSLFLKKRLGIESKRLFCTKIASKVARTYTERHGLKELVREFTGEPMDKSLQTSDWGRTELTPEQIKYAAGDVLHLFKIKRGLSEILIRESRMDLANRLFEFIPTQVELDLLGYNGIFEH